MFGLEKSPLSTISFEKSIQEKKGRKYHYFIYFLHFFPKTTLKKYQLLTVLGVLEVKIAVLNKSEESKPPLKTNNGGLLSAFSRMLLSKDMVPKWAFFPAKHFQNYFFFLRTKNRFQKYMPYIYI